MRLLVYLPLLIPALAAVAARPLAARLEPRQGTWLLTAAAVALAACSTAALALLAATAAAQVPALADLGNYSQTVIHRADPASAVTGAVAAIVLTVAAVAVAIAFRHRAHALAESYRRAARLHAKGLLARERAGRGFAYTPVDEASLAAGQMSRALDGGADHDAVLTRFVSGLSGRDARLLRRLLDAGEDGG